MKRNKFNLSNEHKLTCDMGEIIPLQCLEVNPGDTFRASSALLLRTTPLNAPVLHPVICRVHHFFVPFRLIWTDWPDFITGGEDGLDASVKPYINLSAVTEGSLYDYMGLPVDTYGGTIQVDAMPYRAYSLIFNEYYRDQQLVTERTIDKTDGQDTTTDVTIAKCAWEKDYFTSLRPDTKLGADVTIPLGNSADVYPASGNLSYSTSPPASALDAYDDSSVTVGDYRDLYIKSNVGSAPYKLGEADLTTATGIDIADLQLAFAVQRFQERHNNYGARYSEYLRYLGVNNDLDARLQRPEYLGGGKAVMSFSEVLSTDGSNTGDMKGHGITAMRTNKYQRFFPEHGYQISLLSVIPRTLYMNGIPRKFLRAAKEDYYQREFAHIGDQTVTNKEVYAAHGTPDGTFGYGPRYDELRTERGNISGELNSTLNYWHLARDFGSNPALNSTFIEATPTKRHLQSTATDGLVVAAYNQVAARRMMSKRSKSKIL